MEKAELRRPSLPYLLGSIVVALVMVLCRRCTSAWSC